MSDVASIVLGIVQGLTEFLPVSSSGHLVLASVWLGFQSHDASLELAVDIATNTGTFLAVLVVLRRDVAKAVVGFLRGLVSADARSEDGWRLAMMVLVGSVPTVVLGLAVRQVFERLNSPVPVSLALIVTGVILWTAPRHAPRREASTLSWRDALVAGVAQGVAVIPGISRSGSTISALAWRGVDPSLGARLSFLMYLVASAGVAILGIAEVREAGIGVRSVVLMTIASFVTGWVALHWLFRILARGRFRWFAPYLWFVAGATLLRVVLA